MSGEKILVIGSNCFSGSHFVTGALRAGHAVWVIHCPMDNREWPCRQTVLAMLYDGW